MTKKKSPTPANTKGLLRPFLKEKIKDLGPSDIVVGILCKNVAPTILHVLNTVSEGLHKHFPEYSKTIVVSDGFSSDRTVELAKIFQPYNGIQKLVVEDIVEGGKGAGVKTIVEIADTLYAKTLVLVDGDLLSIKPEWIREFATPILYGRGDLVIPYYIRDKYDGVITNNLAYPFTRALYGLDIRQPLAGEFGMSRRLYTMLLDHPLFPLHFGIDIFVVTTAIANNLPIKEGIYSLKLHESTTMYLEPEALLIPMFRQVTGEMFSLATYYETFWKEQEKKLVPLRQNECCTQKPIPVEVDLENLKKIFKREYTSTRKMMKYFLPADFIKHLEPVGKNLEKFDESLWVDTVYHFAVAYKKARKNTEKTALLDTLKTWWFGRFTSFAIETWDMDLNEAEGVIQRQAELFEKRFDWFHGIY